MNLLYIVPGSHRVLAVLTLGLLLQASATVTVDGRVVSSTTSAPIRKATVTLQSGAAERSAITGVDGRFRIADLAPGNYRLKAERAGFLPDESEYEIEAQENVADLDLKLDPQAVLAGHVLDEDGDPLPGAEVTYRRYRNGKHGQAIESGGNEADADGYFLIAGLRPGHYTLSARPPEKAAAGVHEIYIETYYPNATGEEGATPLKLAAGAEIRNLEVRLRKAQAYRVRGRYVIAGGDDAIRVNLNLVPDPKSTHPGPGSYSVTAREGRFQFPGVQPGAYVITTGQNFSEDQSTGDYLRHSLSCYYPVTVASDMEDLVVNLGPGIEVTGHVRSSGAEKKVGLRLMPLLPRPDLTVPVKKDGTFAISKCPADHYRLQIIPPKGDYVSLILFNGEEVKERMLDLTAGAGGVLEIGLGSPAAEVTATAKGREGARVIIWSRDASVSAIADTDDKGETVFTSLAPGEYRIAAWESYENAPDTTPEALKECDAIASRLELREGARKTVELSPVPAE